MDLVPVQITRPVSRLTSSKEKEMIGYALYGIRRRRWQDRLGHGYGVSTLHEARKATSSDAKHQQGRPNVRNATTPEQKKSMASPIRTSQDQANLNYSECIGGNS